jgi:hypothetical protein
VAVAVEVALLDLQLERRPAPGEQAGRPGEHCGLGALHVDRDEPHVVEASAPQ